MADGGDAPSHATTYIDRPLLAFVGLAGAVTLLFALVPGALEWSLPLACEPSELVTALLCAALAWTVVAMVREEERLNARGETLFPGRVRFDRRKVRERTDRALREGIRGLVDGEDVSEVIERLQAATHRGDALPDGRPRLYYDMALDCMRDAAGRDRVLEWELRVRELMEAEKWLWAARAEWLRGMILRTSS